MPEPTHDPQSPAPARPNWLSLAIVVLLALACAGLIVVRLSDPRTRAVVVAAMIAGGLLVVAGWALAVGARRQLALLAVIGALGASLVAAALIEHHDSAPLPAASPAPASPDRQSL